MDENKSVSNVDESIITNNPIEEPVITEPTPEPVYNGDSEEKNLPTAEEIPQEETTSTVEKSPVEETSQVEQPLENNTQISEQSTIDGISDPVNINPENQEIVFQNEFSSPEEIPTEVAEGTPIGKTPIEQPTNEGTPIKPKKKINKTLIIVLVIVVIFGGAMLLMNLGNKKPINNNNKDKEKEEINVNVGTDWGNKYLAYMMEEKPNIKKYEISFVDVNFDETPEMFVKYIDNSNKESMIILYIADDGFVYETKYYRDYRIRLIYSLKDKNVDWYLYLTTTKHYGSYTSIGKILDNMAFDADIKATNDTLLIEYGKKYYDTDYQPIFYHIKETNTEDDFKDFVSKYNGYNQKVNETIEQVKEKYKNYEYKEEIKETNDTISLIGRLYKYGSYIAEVPENVEMKEEAHTAVIVLYQNNKISIGGKMYSYTVVEKNSHLLLDNGIRINLYSSNIFEYAGNQYKYFN